MADPVLRKAALEASGLTVEMWPCYPDQCGYWYPYWDLHGTFDALAEVEKATWKDQLCVVDIREDNPSSRYTYAPAVESDPGVSEPWFLGWCERNEYRANLYIESGYSFSLVIWHKAEKVGSVRGVTASECRARAVIAAAKRKEQP